MVVCFPRNQGQYSKTRKDEDLTVHNLLREAGHHYHCHMTKADGIEHLQLPKKMETTLDIPKATYYWENWKKTIYAAKST